MNFLLVLSCGQNASEKKLLGKWYGLENNGFTRLYFYSDSLLVIEDSKKTVDWNATESKIDFNISNVTVLDSLSNVSVYYNLSRNGDTLFGDFRTEKGEFKMHLLRANNYLEYLNRRYKIEFFLPEDNEVELLDTDPIYGLKVFIGVSNGKMVARTELTDNLNNLRYDIEGFKDSIAPSEEDQIETHALLLDRKFHLRVFADKEIPDSVITQKLKVTVPVEFATIAKHLPERFREEKQDSLPIRIYRIYQSEEETDLGILNGKEINSLAKIVYY
ncbi:hypothetical protein [Mangrovimonas sp. TPBH4]|uniref:hypothetical protein n=1 Tax=Mangrovimonas sp. TPBH4 TaxID=1645914 RepID=UPI0006B5EE8D|nr:hypothetical protein [Mangrovimonas sp. TPBH4]